jgi:DNA-binding FadR family transcriptional regulator
MLAAKGLVESRPKTGTRINPRSKWNWMDPDILEWVFQAEPQKEVLDGLFELRHLIEPAAAALAAQRRTGVQLKTLRGWLDEMRRHGLASEEGRQADLAFHAVLLDATHNLFLIALATSIGAAVYASTAFKQRQSPLRRNPIPDHERVYEAVAAREPARAEQAMRSLLHLARDDTPVRRARSSPEQGAATPESGYLISTTVTDFEGSASCKPSPVLCAETATGSTASGTSNVLTASTRGAVKVSPLAERNSPEVVARRTVTDSFGSRLTAASQTRPRSSRAAMASTRGKDKAPAEYTPGSTRTGRKVAS